MTALLTLRRTLKLEDWLFLVLSPSYRRIATGPAKFEHFADFISIAAGPKCGLASGIDDVYSSIFISGLCVRVLLCLPWTSSYLSCNVLMDAGLLQESVSPVDLQMTRMYVVQLIERWVIHPKMRYWTVLGKPIHWAAVFVRFASAFFDNNPSLLWKKSQRAREFGLQTLKLSLKWQVRPICTVTHWQCSKLNDTRFRPNIGREKSTLCWFGVLGAMPATTLFRAMSGSFRVEWHDKELCLKNVPHTSSVVFHSHDLSGLLCFS